MGLIKIFIFAMIIGASSVIGIMIAKKYANREFELKEMKNALNMFENKIKFTYEDIPTVFSDISQKISGNVGKIFKTASIQMKDMQAGIAWEYAVNNTWSNFNKEDIDIIKGLGRMLGKTDLNGQISEINLVENFIDNQLEEAKLEKEKNAKMYKTLGLVIGITIVIILAWPKLSKLYFILN